MIEDLADLFESGSRTASCTATSSSRPTTPPTTSCAAASSRATGRSSSAGPPPAGQRALSRDDWQGLIYLAHTDKAEAFELYSTHYLATSGQTLLLGRAPVRRLRGRLPRAARRALGAPHPSTEMICELYVPRERLADFMAAVADDFRANSVDVDLRDDPADRARRGVVPRVGDGPLGMHHLQPAHAAHARGHRALGRRLPPPHRPRDRARRLVLPHLPPLGDARSGRDAATRSSATSCERSAEHDPDGAVPERLVPALRSGVRRRARMTGEAPAGLTARGRRAAGQVPARRRRRVRREPRRVRAARDGRARRTSSPRSSRTSIANALMYLGNRYFTFRLGNDGLLERVPALPARRIRRGRAQRRHPRRARRGRREIDPRIGVASRSCIVTPVAFVLFKRWTFRLSSS